jgi:deoxyribose-phosphate aldolase
LRLFAKILTVSGLGLLAVPAAAQQFVETSTGTLVAGDTCSVSEAMLTEIQGVEAAHRAETRARLDALLDAALASPKTRMPTATPVTFPNKQPQG